MRPLLPAVLLMAAVLAVPVGTAGSAEQEFTLSVTYSGLYPNADLPVPVTVHNAQPFDLAVHSADVTVGDASPACRAENLIVSSFVGDVVVGAGRNGTIPVRMQMPATAPDACQGATFPLSFRASGSPTTPDARGGTSDFAFTGSESAAIALAGSIAVGLGALLLAARRRRTVVGP